DIVFHSKTVLHAEFSNFFPDVNHNRFHAFYPPDSSLKLTYHGLVFRTVEHLYQYLKFVYVFGDEKYAAESFASSEGTADVSAVIAKKRGSNTSYCSYILARPSHPSHKSHPSK